MYCLRQHAVAKPQVGMLTRAVDMCACALVTQFTSYNKGGVCCCGQALCQHKAAAKAAACSWLHVQSAEVEQHQHVQLVIHDITDTFVLRAAYYSMLQIASAGAGLVEVAEVSGTNFCC